MCNIVSPDKAVLWAFIRSGGAAAWADGLTPDAFAHGPYRKAFQVCRDLGGNRPVDRAAFDAHATKLGIVLAPDEMRDMKRMFRMDPPPRITANIDGLAAMLRARADGQAVNLAAVMAI